MKLKKIISCFLTIISINIYSKADIKYSRNEYKDKIKINPRKSLTSRTYVFPRSQLKYSHYNNYLNWWVDRPLIMRRSLRYPTGTYEHIIKEDFLDNTVQIFKKYNVDGLAAIATPPGHCKMYEKTTQWLKKYKIENFLELAEFSGGGGLDEHSYKYYDKLIKLSINSPNSFKINSKVVISNYCAARWGTSSSLKKLLDKLKKDNGNNFYFVADIGSIIDHFLRDHIVHLQKQINDIKSVEINELKQELRSWLDVCDGLHYASIGHISSSVPTYAKKYQNEYYKDFIIPVLREIMDEQKYRGKKILGLSAALGYTNFLSGTNKSEMNTRRLRQTLESAISAKPDYIVLPEWNEVNENTCIQPTVSNGWTTQRIIKYFMSVIKQEKPSPNKYDDINIPNLVLSYRKTLKYGEVIEIEMLNVPDSESSKFYSAQLRLKGVNDKVLYAFPSEKFQVKTMKDITFNIPSEQFSDEYVIKPELVVTNLKGAKLIFNNFHYIRLHPTVSWDYQSVKQCLRDMLTPEIADFKVNKDGNEVNISANVKFNEPLASVEVLENEREIFSFDKLNEFNKNRDFIIYFEGSAAKTLKLKGKIKFIGTSNIYIRPTERANSDFLGLEYKNNELKINQRINSLHRAFFIRIPLADAAKTSLECDFLGKKFTLPVNQLMQNRVFGLALNKNQCYIQMSRFDKQPDIPVIINEKTAEFSFKHKPISKYPVYSLRAISVSGKIFRNQGIMPFKPTEMPKTNLNVWSEYLEKVTKVRVSQNRIPEITYTISPLNGDALKCKWSSFWDGELGGGTKYGDPFNRRANYPPNVNKCAPDKIKDSTGKYCLDFDGKGNYFTIPREALPRGAFTLSFKIKPTSLSPQIIFKHQGIYIGSLTLMLEEGKLSATFTDSKIKTTKFDTDLKIPVNEWSKIKITYDYENLIFSVNNKSKSYPFTERALNFAPCAIGGHLRSDFGVTKDMQFFKGRLKEFKIIHNANN